jgi:hypothetical protein
MRNLRKRDPIKYTELEIYVATQGDKYPIKPNDGQVYHLDHIIPLSFFDPYDFRQQKICWDHRNMQWLPSKVNLQKSNWMRDEYFNHWHLIAIETCQIYKYQNKLTLETNTEKSKVSLDNVA